MTVEVVAMLRLAHPPSTEAPEELDLLVLRCFVIALGVLAPSLAIFGDTYHPDENRPVCENITPLGWFSITLMIALLGADVTEAWLEHKREIEDERVLQDGHDKISMAVVDVQNRVGHETDALDREVQRARQGLLESISMSHRNSLRSLTQVQSEVVDARRNLGRQQQAVILARHESLSDEFQRLQYDVDNRVHPVNGNLVTLRDTILRQDQRFEKLLIAIEDLRKNLPVGEESRESED